MSGAQGHSCLTRSCVCLEYSQVGHSTIFNVWLQLVAVSMCQQWVESVSHVGPALTSLVLTGSNRLCALGSQLPIQDGL